VWATEAYFICDSMVEGSCGGNGYLKPEYPTVFTRYEDVYRMISLPAGILIITNLYPLGRWVRI
jgi:hypothetical protein